MSYAERNSRTKKLTGRHVCDAEFKHPDGSTTRWHKAFDSKKEADGAEAYYRATGNPPPSIKLSKTTFRAVAEEFKGRNSDWVNAHGVTNKQRLEFCINVLGDFDVAEVRLRQLETLVDKVLKQCGRGDEPPANRTVNYYLDAASKVLRFAFDRDMLPMGMPTVPRLENTGKKRPALSEATEKAVCESLVSEGLVDWAFLIHLLAASGMRMGELYAIERGQIKDDGLILTEEQTKTSQTRWVPLSSPEAAWLYQCVRKGLPNRVQLYRFFKRKCLLLGESKAMTLHCLRHTCVTRLGERKVSEMDIAVIVGHSKKSVTQGYYHPSPEHVRECSDKVHNVIGEFVSKHKDRWEKVAVFSRGLEATTRIELVYTVLQTVA